MRLLYAFTCLLLPLLLQTVPAGHPDAFTGKVFVFSGVLPSLYREQATDLVAGHGGRSTKDVSGKSSFLVVGNNCSRRKFDKVSRYPIRWGEAL
jgi:replication factor C subunit 1